MCRSHPGHRAGDGGLGFASSAARFPVRAAPPGVPALRFPYRALLPPRLRSAPPPHGSPAGRDPRFARIACAPSPACARFARLIARASRRTHVSPGFRWGFFRAGASANGSSLRMPLPAFVPGLFYHTSPECKPCAGISFVFFPKGLTAKETLPTSRRGGAGYVCGRRGHCAEGREPMTGRTTCPALERTPGNLSRARVFADTRSPPFALCENPARGLRSRSSSRGSRASMNNRSPPCWNTKPGRGEALPETPRPATPAAPRGAGPSVEV